MTFLVTFRPSPAYKTNGRRTLHREGCTVLARSENVTEITAEEAAAFARKSAHFASLYALCGTCKPTTEEYKP